MDILGDFVRWQSVVLFITGSLSTILGVALGTQKWKIKVESDIQSTGAAITAVGHRVSSLESERHTARPYCPEHTKEILRLVRKDICEVVERAIEKEQLRLMKLHTDTEEARRQDAINFALLTSKNEVLANQISKILDEIKELRDWRTQKGTYKDRSHLIRSTDQVNPRTGEIAE